MKTAAFIMPEHLAAIRSLSLRARLIVEGFFAGLHKSPFHGFSTEFLEYRPYRAGESIRAIDWRAFARTDRAVVRVFEDETNLRAHILLDKSASMLFSSRRGTMTKLDYCKTLAAALALILIRQRDAAGLAAFDDAVKVFLPPRSTNVQLKAVLSALDRIDGGAETSCGGALESVAKHISRRGLCIILSDLFDDPRHIIRGLRHLRYKRQDVIVLWVLDPLELNFSGGVSYKLRDYETRRELSIDGRTASRFFRNGLKNHRDAIARACRDLSVDLETISTAEPFQKALLRVMEKRKRLR
ncbi:MAG: DUF58 domain-containing protein [Chitinispirillaceae bacterium]|nr:DUF58 domain-containing protein [Chitinispirillaceae bacterium]